MTKTKTNSHRVPVYRRPVIIIGVLCVMIVVAVLTIIILNLSRSSQSSQSESSSQPSSPAPSQPERPSADQPSTPETPSDKDILQYEGGDPNDENELSGYVAVKSVDEGVLTIVASISQYLQSEGSCTLTLYQSGEAAASSTLAALPDVTSSVCGPFEFLVSDLSPGSYIIDIAVSGDGKTGHISDEIEI